VDVKTLFVLAVDLGYAKVEVQKRGGTLERSKERSEHGGNSCQQGPGRLWMCEIVLSHDTD